MTISQNIGNAVKSTIEKSDLEQPIKEFLIEIFDYEISSQGAHYKKFYQEKIDKTHALLKKGGFFD